MPDVVAAQLPVTDAVVAALAAATGHPVGDGDAPADTSGPYTVVYGWPGGRFEGSMGEPFEMAVLRYRVDSVNRSRRGCELLADRNRAALLAGDFDADGWRVMYVDVVPGAPVNEGRDESNDLAVFVCRDDFTFQVTKGPLPEDEP